jgi:2-polyprenyl-3-methyl-5-hydroxy-6-metoxy-1,4-benzoquinol methylase
MERESGKVVLERAPCPLGCAAGDRLVLRGRDRLHHLPGDFQVVRCRGCGLMRTDPRPDFESIGFYYPAEYGPWMQGDRPVLGKAGGIKKVLKSLLWDTRVALTPALPPGRLLEIGCGSGAYLDQMAAKGWRVEGIEPSPEAAAKAAARGHSVRVARLESLSDPGGPFDLVVGWMVLEHLHEPVRALRKLAAWTAPGGVLALSVPDAAAAEFRLFGSRWYALHLPNHLYHFTAPTVTRLLEAAGWRVERIVSQRFLGNLPGSMAHVFDDLLGRPNPVSNLLLELAGPRAYLLYLTLPLATLLAAAGQTGRLTLWARKIHP